MEGAPAADQVRGERFPHQRETGQCEHGDEAVSHRAIDLEKVSVQRVPPRGIRAPVNW
jgi:hypothetical protein